MPPADPTLRDEDLPGFLATLGVPGIFDVHVHSMPPRMQAAVWAHFDELEPEWPITYRLEEDERLDLLPRLGIVRHTTLAYAHRPGVAAWLNHHTLALAARHPQVVGSFTLYPEPEADEYVARALAGGGRCVKVHLQVGKFDPTDPRLGAAWAQVEAAGIPVIIHAAAVEDGSGGEEWCGVSPVRRLLGAHPGLQLVVAHLGMPDTMAFLDLADEHPHLRFDTAMAVIDPPYLAEQPAGLADRLAPLRDRILFGSDFPSIPATVANQVGCLARLGLGDDWLRAVLWDNAAALFDGGGSR